MAPLPIENRTNRKHPQFSFFWAFWLLSDGFQQLGEHALLPPAAAAWAPIAIFAGGALYFISRVRT